MLFVPICNHGFKLAIRCSAVRMVSAAKVNVGLEVPIVGKLPEPTMDPAVVARTATTVFGLLEVDRPVRLLGVRVVLEMPPP